ncbi:MAG: ATP-binding protein [Saprospiraceae bacterium]|jgi:hypothetical protein|nr:ATP-binding protein [Saprospiraceae bacterium]
MTKKNTKNVLVNSHITAVNSNIGDNITNNYFVNILFTISVSNPFITKVSSDLLEQTIPTFDRHQAAIDEFFQNPRKRILLITGSGETGKTHLLRNLILVANDKGWHTFGIEPPALGLSSQALPDDAPSLLFRDDIDWEKDDFLLSVLQLIDGNPNLRLILTAHSSWSKKIMGVIQQIKDLPAKVQSIDLPLWKHEHLIMLLRLSSKAPKVKHEEDIARQFANPYLLKYFGESMNNSPKIKIEAISQNFAVKIRRVFEQNVQPELGADKVQPFIFHLVFNMVHDHLLGEFAQNLGIDQTSLLNILERLKTAGMIRHRFGGWFIIPEVKGDFYVAGKLEHQPETTIAALLLPHVKQQAKYVVNKIVAVARYVSNHSRKALCTFLNHQLKKWEQQIRENPETLQRHHITAATEALLMEQYYGQEIAANVTDAACSFILYAFTNQTQASNRTVLDENVLTVSFSNNPTGEEYGRFLEVLAHLPRKRTDYLTILQELWLSGWKTNVSNYQPANLLANAFKPFDEYNDFESYKIGIQYARSWLLQTNNPVIRILAVEALQTMLGGFFEHIRSEYNSIIFGTNALPNNTHLFQLRAEAIDLIVEAMQKEELLLDCLRILDDIGQGKRFHSHEDLFKLQTFPQIQQEIERCIPVIGEALCRSQDFLVQKTAETTLLKWWLWGVSNKMEPWLLRFERTPEYLFYRCVMDNWCMTDDFALMAAKAPKEKRWEWYWRHSDLKEKRALGAVEQHKGLVQKLSQKYSTPEQIAHFIRDSIEKTNVWEKTEGRGDSIHQLTRIVQCWAIVVPEPFKKLLSYPGLSTLLPEWTRSEIEIQLIRVGQYSQEEIAVPLLAKIPNLTHAEMSQLVFLIQKHQPVQKEKWLMKMIDEGQEFMLYDIASRLCFIFKGDNEVAKVADCLLRILNSGKITQEGFFGRDFNYAGHAYKYLFSNLDQIPAECDECLRSVTFDLVKKMSKLDAHEKDVLQYCIREADHLIDFFDYRATHFTIENSLRKSDFRVGEVLLADVFSSEELRGIFKTPENHRQFINKIGKWEQAALICFPDWRNPYLDVNDPVTKEPWIIRHLQNALAENNLEDIERYCVYVPRGENFLDMMLQAWQRILPSQSDEDMERILYHWATYHRYSSGFFGEGYNRYDRPKAFWELLSKQPILDLRMKMLIQRVGAYLEEQWQKRSEDL